MFELLFRRSAPFLAALAVLLFVLVAMPASAQNFGTLNSHYVFPVFQTCEDYFAKTGRTCPPFDATRKVKSWYDPSPPAADEDGNVSYLLLATAKDGTPLVREGKPYQRTVLIPRSEAVSVNIPPKRFDGTIPDVKTIGEWGVPMRALGAGEEFYIAWGGLPAIRQAGSTPTSGGGQSGPDVTTQLSAIQEAIEVLTAKVNLLLAASGQRAGNERWHNHGDASTRPYGFSTAVGYLTYSDLPPTVCDKGELWGTHFCDGSRWVTAPAAK